MYDTSHIKCCENLYIIQIFYLPSSVFMFRSFIGRFPKQNVSQINNCKLLSLLFFFTNFLTCKPHSSSCNGEGGLYLQISQESATGEQEKVQISVDGGEAQGSSALRCPGWPAQLQVHNQQSCQLPELLLLALNVIRCGGCWSYRSGGFKEAKDTNPQEIVPVA